MAKENIAKIDDNVWLVTAKRALLGAEVGNRMTVIKLNSAHLFVHSPIKLDDEIKTWISSIGDVGSIIAPNYFHNSYSQSWGDAYPNAEIYAPPGVKQINSYRKLGKDNDEAFSQIWQNTITCITLAGTPKLKESVFIHHPSRSLILTDLCFNIGGDTNFWTKTLLTLYGAYNRFGPTRLLKSLIREQSAFQQSIEEILSHDFDRIIVSHGEIVTDNGKDVFKKAFSFLN